jgi:hypothetical protein
MANQISDGCVLRWQENGRKIEREKKGPLLEGFLIHRVTSCVSAPESWHSSLMPMRLVSPITLPQCCKHPDFPFVAWQDNVKESAVTSIVSRSGPSTLRENWANYLPLNKAANASKGRGCLPVEKDGGPAATTPVRIAIASITIPGITGTARPNPRSSGRGNRI